MLDMSIKLHTKTKIEEMRDTKQTMLAMSIEMKDLRSIAAEAINLHDDFGNDIIDMHYDLASVIPELSRLADLVKHRVDNQNFVLQCMFYSLDEQFLLLCDLANTLEEASDLRAHTPSL